MKEDFRLSVDCGMKADATALLIETELNGYGNEQWVEKIAGGRHSVAIGY
jgi:hypothetical protein